MSLGNYPDDMNTNAMTEIPSMVFILVITPGSCMTSCYVDFDADFDCIGSFTGY
jgi:hypothetical protein